MRRREWKQSDMLPGSRSSNLTYPQYLCLLILCEKGPVTVWEIGRRLPLDSSTPTPLLKKLGVKGLTSRKRSPGDERTLEIHITTEGRDLKAGAEKVHMALFENFNMPAASLRAT